MTPMKIVVEKTNTGYSAYAPDVEGYAVATVGSSYKELKENIADVLAMYAEVCEEDGDSEKAEFFKTATPQYYLDVEQFFEHFYMINKTAFARFIGMNESQMRQLGNGLVPLSDKKALQLQNGLHTLAKDLGAVHFA